MKSLIRLLIVLISLAAVAALRADEASKLDKLTQSFDSRRATAVEEHAKAAEKLRMSYRVALERLQDKAQKSGKLEDVLPVRDEIARIDKEEETLPPLGATASAELKKLRETYDQASAKAAKAHAEEIVAMSDKMIGLLEKESADLTKAGKIDEALAVNRQIEAIGNDAGIADARGLVLEANPIQAGKAISLLKAKRTIVEQGAFWVGTIDGKEGSGSYSPLLEGLAPEGKEHLFLHPPSRTRFEFERPVTRFTCGLYVARTGSVTVRLFVGNRKVSEAELDAAAKRQRTWDLKFKETDVIEIEVDPNGNPSDDLFYLVDPMAD